MEHTTIPRRTRHAPRPAVAGAARRQDERSPRPVRRPTARAQFSALLASLEAATLVAGTPAAAGGTVTGRRLERGGRRAADDALRRRAQHHAGGGRGRCGARAADPGPGRRAGRRQHRRRDAGLPGGHDAGGHRSGGRRHERRRRRGARPATVPVAPAALAAVADALPTPTADTASDTAGDAPGEGDAKDDGQGAMPVTVATTVDDGVTTLPPPRPPMPRRPRPPRRRRRGGTSGHRGHVRAVRQARRRRPQDGRHGGRRRERVDHRHDGRHRHAGAVTIAGADRNAAADATQVTARVDHERFERLADGLAARLSVSHAGDGARIRMHLDPAELGEVVVRLEIRNGLATAHLIAETGRCRAAARRPRWRTCDSSLADRGLQPRERRRYGWRARATAQHGPRTPRPPQPQGDRSGAPLRRSRSAASTPHGPSRPRRPVGRAREGQAVWMLA